MSVESMAVGRLGANPFAARLPDLGVHERRPGRRCELLTAEHGLIDFAERPTVPEPAEAVGRVILVAGRPQLGKSVFTHHCLHEFELAGHVPVDLTDTVGSELNAETGPATCAERIVLRLTNEGRLSAAQSARIRTSLTRSWNEGHLALGQALKTDRLVVRIPPADATLTGEAVAREVALYAAAARSLNDSIFLYEYSYWAPSDWRDLRFSLSARGADDCLIREAELFSQAELQTFVDSRLRTASDGNPAFDLRLDRLLDQLSQRTPTFGPNSITWLNGLCHRAFDIALDTGSPAVDAYHFLQAAMESDKP